MNKIIMNKMKKFLIKKFSDETLKFLDNFKYDFEKY